MTVTEVPFCLENCHFALDSSLVRMKPSRRFLPHTDCDASVTTLVCTSPQPVCGMAYLSNVTTGVVGSRVSSRRSSSLILFVTGGLVTRKLYVLLHPVVQAD